VRKILAITTTLKIYDIPDDVRKIHGAGIPSLGGIGIFLGYILVASFFWPGRPLSVGFFLTPTLLLFFTGVYDDLMNMSPLKKLIVQLAASAIPVYFANISIGSLCGMVGIEALPQSVSLVITILGCTLFINAFNFIDGIDGLACVLAIIYALTLGLLFASLGALNLAILSFCVAGGTLGLLFYNFSPAKIYMGDTGSMLLGFTIFILSVVYLHLNTAGAWIFTARGRVPAEIIHSEKGALLVVLAILFLPTFDALRVFVLRLSKGRSPLRADRTHLHYYLLDAGCSHPQAVLIIATINVIIIALAFLLQDMNPLIGFTCMLVLVTLSMVVVYLLRQKNLSKRSPVNGKLSV